MAEEGPAPAMASATDHEYNSHNNQQPAHITPNPPINTSRKSTLNKSDFDIHVNGTQTPMSGTGNRESRHILDLDDYFVCLSCSTIKKREKDKVLLRMNC
jgi:hypothetical protein